MKFKKTEFVLNEPSIKNHLELIFEIFVDDFSSYSHPDFFLKFKKLIDRIPECDDYV